LVLILRLILNIGAAMILCICRSVTDREVDAAVHAGARSLADVAEASGAGSDCGCCRKVIERRIERGCAGDCANCPRSASALASAAL
jgi:bacterioferritin-associated ferredoxin